MMESLEKIKKDLENEVIVQTARSSGPGGQNVNKTNSKVILYWDFLQSLALSSDQKERFKAHHAHKINSEGFYYNSSEAGRSQKLNYEFCLDKLISDIKSILKAPLKRKKTKPSKSVIAKNKIKKKRDSETKKMRKKIV